MERCDFSSIMTIIRTYISEDRGMNQIDFLYLLFDSFISSDDTLDFDFDNGLVCRWMNGQAKVSQRISKHFLQKENQQNLAINIFENLLPLMYDSAMAAQKIYELVIRDDSISENKKLELTKSYPCDSLQKEADFICKILCFGMSREFIKRDSRTKKLLSAGDLSPMLADFIMGNEPPKPCRYFCGREQEIKQLHEILTEHSKVFLHGIAGMGKSELAKAYAKQYKKDYTNILFLTYSGDLKQDITDLDFADDLPEDSEEERFRKHNRFMRSLKGDTLLIVDNFNTQTTKDCFLSVVMKYRCQILFTTRSRFDNYPSMELSEISDRGVLLNLMGNYFSDATKYLPELEQMLDVVHCHTLAVELIARLLEHGILEPKELLRKLQEEKIALDAADKISITKDGTASKETYYGHIHTLFSLYLLSDAEKGMMRCMALMPVAGISLRLFANWMCLSDLNTINDLIEIGFISPQPGRSVSLHPMVQEIVIADEPPTVSNCKTLLSSLQGICLCHGIEVSYYKTLFVIVQNVMAFAVKNDLPFYLRFLEDVFPYMEKYQYEAGLKTTLKEMECLLSLPDIGTASDKALLLDYQAALEKNKEKAIKLEKQAIELISEVNEGNALLAANIQSNLGGLYHQIKQYSLAKQHMEAGIAIMENFHLVGMHDTITQFTSYAVVLHDLGEPDRAMSALRKLARIVKELNSDTCGDYASIQETMGAICLAQADIKSANEHFQKALRIYETIWCEEPELLQAKYEEIQAMYPQAGIGIGQSILKRLS